MVPDLVFPPRDVEHALVASRTRNSPSSRTRMAVLAWAEAEFDVAPLSCLRGIVGGTTRRSSVSAPPGVTERVRILRRIASAAPLVVRTRKGPSSGAGARRRVVFDRGTAAHPSSCLLFSGPP